jgi:hypothetical protein
MAEQPANNTLTTTPDGIFVLTQTGYQTAASVSMFQGKIEEAIAKHHQQGKKFLLLIDVSGVTGHDSEARSESLKRLNGDYDAMAIFGNNTVIRLIISWLIRTAGDSERVQFFSNQDEALEWLHSKM